MLGGLQMWKMLPENCGFLAWHKAKRLWVSEAAIVCGIYYKGQVV